MRLTLRRPFFISLTFLSVAFAIVALAPHSNGSQNGSSIGSILVSYRPEHPSNTFIPSQTIGAALDGHEKGQVMKMLSPGNVRQMKSAGLKPLTYRLRTELAVETWHWNPRGHWSDPARRQGYWISDDRPGTPINLSYGYKLPRRGGTMDQANDNGYSRLDDGDLTSFWKSNPYLDKLFTGEDDSLHPQWVVIDLKQEEDINALRILWGAPFATRFKVQYWKNIVADEFVPRDDQWIDFQAGTFASQHGGDVPLKLCDNPVHARFVRILMFDSSGTAKRGSKDQRDRAGFAIRELYAGKLDNSGKLLDVIAHHPDNGDQTYMYVSSTDPWHRATDKDNLIEQPGFDFVFKSGLTSGQPMLTPVGVLYDTPENAAAEVSFLQRRGYPVNRIEMGEEPDGQFGEPEDYAMLYMQFADAIHRADARMQLGGPGFENLDPDDPDDPNFLSHPKWTKRFLDVIKAHNRLSDFNFFTFEWYPFDDVCLDTSHQLAVHRDKFAAGLAGIDQVLPPNTPKLLTELGYSAFGGEVEVRIEGALLNADATGLFLTSGGEHVYLYGYEPNELIGENSCSSLGNNMLFGMAENGRVRYTTATYQGARMMTELWAQPADEPVEIYPAHSDIKSGEGNELVTAYAIRSARNQWSLMILNKDPQRTYTVHVATDGDNKKLFKGPTDLFQYSNDQYHWIRGDDPHPTKTEPPRHSVLAAGTNGITLPPYSITVARASR